MTVHQYFTTAGWIRRDHDNWRVFPEPPTGEVEGIPSLRGTLLCTNGVLAMLRTQDRRFLEIHLKTFKADQLEGFEDVVDTTKRKKKTDPPIEDYSKYI